jgi:hypothetical protein
VVTTQSKASLVVRILVRLAALPAAVTVEDIFTHVHIERRLAFLMQWTESDILGLAGGPPCPVVLTAPPLGASE